MRIFVVHNSYRQPGGEDRVFASETQLLEERGHDVLTYSRHTPAGGAAVLRLVGQSFWNQHAYRELRDLIRSFRPDVVHLHNTFPLISPAACYAARREGIPVVKTLHNYRLLCPNGLFFRNGRPCEDCVRASAPWPAVIHACYRDSYPASIVAAGTLALHQARSTWINQVDRYIALTEFARQKFIDGGLPADKILVKPNFVARDPGPGRGDGRFALFVGRLSREKGIETLLAARPSIENHLRLVIAGDGPLASSVRLNLAGSSAATWLGQRSPEDVRELMGTATCVIVPSVWYETFGLVVAEAFARGTPVVAARLGALAELVDHQRTGLLFTPGDAADLARQVTWMAEHPAAVMAMRKAARAEYERLYSVDSNYTTLLKIYTDAIAAAGHRQPLIH